MDELGRLSVAAFKAAVKRPVCVVLDNVRSMHNIGSAFRTGDAFRIERLYLCGITATPPHREIHKAALGATESVDWEYREDTLELVRDLTARGYAVYAVEQTENSTALQAFGSALAASGPAAVQPLALVFGNEVHGVQQAVVDACRGTIEIPQEGTKHSLNVSVSIGIVLWELCRGGLVTDGADVAGMDVGGANAAGRI